MLARLLFLIRTVLTAASIQSASSARPHEVEAGTGREWLIL
jgi:hypothetical protein